MTSLEFVDRREAIASGREHRRGYPLDEITNVAAWKVASLQRVQRCLDGPALVVAQNDNQGDIQKSHAVLDRAENRRVDGVARCTNHEHIAEPLVENDFGGDPGVRTTEQNCPWLLTIGEAFTIDYALTRMQGLTGDETLVTLLERLPSGNWIRIRHELIVHRSQYENQSGSPNASAQLRITAGEIVPIDTTALLGWFDTEERDLAWRRDGVTGWQILMSEIMLQQTPVSRVAPIWEQWVERWPVPSAMAASPQAEVLRAWGKLGYPRRALRLHECARVLATEHDDIVPQNVETLLELPGIGEYTARAVACFAYGQRVPVVDTNVRRVVARAVHGNAEPGNPSTKRDLADVESLLPRTHAKAARYSAALMELGALVCTAKKPACVQCPLPTCSWIDAGSPPHTGPAKKVQKFAGTDRQVRGKLMSVLRESETPVPRAQLDVVWLSDPGQRDRALDSLLVDGLVEQTASGLFALAGEG